MSRLGSKRSRLASALISSVIVAGVPVGVALSAAPASAACATTTQWGFQTLDQNHATPSTISSSASITAFRLHHYAIARGIVKVRDAATVTVSVNVLVDACPGGVSNPVSKTAVDSESMSYASLKTATATAHRPLTPTRMKAAARTKAKESARSAASTVAVSTAIDLAKSMAISVAEQRAEAQARSASSSGSSGSGATTSGGNKTYAALPSADQIGQAVLAQINAARAAGSVAAETNLEPVRLAEQGWAQHLSDTAMRDHPLSDSDHSTIDARTLPTMDQCTYIGAQYEIMDGYFMLTPGQTVQQMIDYVAQTAVYLWKNEPTHNTIMMNSNTNRIGVGVGMAYDADGYMKVVVVAKPLNATCPF